MLQFLRNIFSTPYLLDGTQMVLAVLLIIAIILQNQGSGLGGAFGGQGNVYRTKRGLEKVLLHATIITSLLFFIIALLNVLF